jgi:hypothetical protein
MGLTNQDGVSPDLDGRISYRSSTARQTFVCDRLFGATLVKIQSEDKIKNSYSSLI